MRVRAKAPSAEPNIGEGPGRSSSRRRLGFLLGTLALAIGAILAPGASPALALCPNEAIRAEQGSTFLPDCRAYELVTPPSLNAKAAPGIQVASFDFPSIVDGGDSYLWTAAIGGLPNTESNGSFNLYEAQRTASGWASTRKGPRAVEAESPEGNNYNADFSYVAFKIFGLRGGSLALCSSCEPIWVRYPDGTFHLLGEGTVPTASDTDHFENGLVDDISPIPQWTSAAGDHQIFRSYKQLTAEAPASGTSALYDRTPSGLKLVSRLPGGAAVTSEVFFAGASRDGRTVLFLGDDEHTLYARLDNEETVEMASDASNRLIPGGVSDDGSRAFFVDGGDIYYYDFEAEEAVPVATPGDAILANVSADGSNAYFVSKTQLVPGKGTPGSYNLYVWDGSSIQFIATVSEEDVVRVPDNASSPRRGLGTWTRFFNDAFDAPATNASFLASTARSTPDGKVFVFQSNAQLTTYPNAGHIDIYRYDTVSEELTCVSCSTIASASSADSELVSLEGVGPAPLNSYAEVRNLSEDGTQVVFDSYDALLPEDVNGLRDVYEWHDGALSLVSTGHSPQGTALYAVTPSGSDIVFGTGDNLVRHGQGAGAYAIYDARVGGGFLEEEEQFCQGESCFGTPTEPPTLRTPASATLQGGGNVTPRCRLRKRHRRHHRGNHATKSTARRACPSARGRSGK